MNPKHLQIIHQIADQNLLIRVCCECHKVLGVKPAQKPGITHAYCGPCATKIKNRYSV